MGAKAVDLAEELGIERESYYRLERFPQKLNNEEMILLATRLGISPDQFWFKPPAEGETELNLNALMSDVPKDIQEMVVKAVRGMVGK